MSRNGSDPSLRGYRAATDALDERPSAATRAAILAAAARQVQAVPRDAREPVALPRVTPRKRWPYAAAAAVLLSSLAVMMATRTEREMPTFTAPAERVAENAAPSRPVPSPEPPQPAAAPPASQEVASTKVAAAKPSCGIRRDPPQHRHHRRAGKRRRPRCRRNWRSVRRPRPARRRSVVATRALTWRARSVR